MAELNLKPTHKPVQDYYTSLAEYDQIDVTHEGAVSSAFLPLLQHCGRQLDWILVTEYPIFLPQNKRIIIDGAFEDAFKRPHGYWEAKDIHDDLPVEVERKFEDGYPRNNILFQTPQRAILWQNGHEVRDADLSDPTQLIEVLDAFFAYRTIEDDEWEWAVEQFGDQVPKLGEGLAEHIKEARRNKPPFT
ncbi:MAG: DNA helicase, partial [Candidatus Poribacteria bacterium]|nr:DNA helicase [Candidatus Poribacteria bacterium]